MNTETHIKANSQLGHIAISPKQWNGVMFTEFNDGDIMDYIDMTDLQHHHDCTQDEPEWSLAWGGRFQCRKKTDFVGLGLSRSSKGISLELANDIDGVLDASDLKEIFAWYITWNTKSNETIVHYSDKTAISQELAEMTWQTVRNWITSNQFLLHIHEYREKVVPIWFDHQ